VGRSKLATGNEDLRVGSIQKNKGGSRRGEETTRKKNGNAVFKEGLTIWWGGRRSKRIICLLEAKRETKAWEEASHLERKRDRILIGYRVAGGTPLDFHAWGAKRIIKLSGSLGREQKLGGERQTLKGKNL